MIEVGETNEEFRNSTKEDMTKLPEEYIGNCVRSMDWKVYAHRYDSGTQ